MESQKSGVEVTCRVLRVSGSGFSLTTMRIDLGALRKRSDVLPSKWSWKLPTHPGMGKEV